MGLGMAGHLRFAGAVQAVEDAMSYDFAQSVREIADGSGVPLTTTRKVLNHLRDPSFVCIREVVTVRIGPVRGAFYWRLKKGGAENTPPKGA